jgi:hypothetical protein
MARLHAIRVLILEGAALRLRSGSIEHMREDAGKRWHANFGERTAMTSNRRRLTWRRSRRIIAWTVLVSFAGLAVLVLAKAA